MSRTQFMKLAEAAGIEVEYDAGSPKALSIGMAYHITLTAPEGKVFRGSGCSVDCSINGERGHNTFEIAPNWTKIAERLKEIISEDFDDDPEG